MSITPTAVFWRPHVAYNTLVLTVSAPDGQVYRHEFAKPDTVVFAATDANGLPHLDGPYVYELLVVPIMDETVKHALARAREAGDNTMPEVLQQRGLIPSEPLTQTGHFTVKEGMFLQPTTESR